MKQKVRKKSVSHGPVGKHSIKSKVYQALQDVGEYGMTPDEYNTTSRGLINTTRRRFVDLWKEGKIKRHPEGLKRFNADGNNCDVWVVGNDRRRKKTRFELMEREIIKLRKILSFNNIDPDVVRYW